MCLNRQSYETITSVCNSQYMPSHVATPKGRLEPTKGQLEPIKGDMRPTWGIPAKSRPVEPPMSSSKP